MFRRLSLLLSSLSCFSVHIFSAQITTAITLGTIRDETVAVLPGVSVTIENPDTEMSRTAVANEAGRYHPPNL